jgi:tripartite-type tricarboxylate transporter receptor subunit TctC
VPRPDRRRRRAASIKALTQTQKRWFAAPDVPTIEEAGVPGVHFPFWHGLWAPKGTPKEIVAALNAAVVDALADPAVRQRYTDVGHEIAPREQQTPEGLYVYHKAEIERWRHPGAHIAPSEGGWGLVPRGAARCPGETTDSVRAV